MMRYKEFAPSTTLAGYIECYWKFWVGLLPDHSAGSPLKHVFPPDGSCNVLFIKSPVYTNVLFTGPTTVVREIAIWPNTLYLGIRLMPGCSFWLNPVEPGSLKDDAIALNEISAWQQVALQKLSIDFDEDIAALETALSAFKAERQFSPDERIVKAAKYIAANAGDVTLKETADHVYMGERQLERMFLKNTGVTFKKFAQLRRLRKAIIDLYAEKKSREEIMEERGYADPSHFYKSFRNIAGYNLDKFQQHLRLIENHLI